MTRSLRALVLGVLGFAVVALAAPATTAAQGRGGRAGGVPQAPPTPRAAAPIDVTGTWVAIVSEDWRWRMGVGVRGDFGYMPLNPQGRKVGTSFDPAADQAAGNQCKAYGAPAIMRVPGRFRIRWDDDTTLRIDVDHGTQTRQLRFGTPAPASAEATTGKPAERSWQGYSVARWDGPGGRGATPRTGELRVVTNNLRAGYYYKHGIPYSENAVMTEYFNRLSDAGEEYLAVTTIVDDPQYLAQPFVRTLQFRRERDDSKWSPTPCDAGMLAVR
jgi:hypothetical protein